MFTYLQQSESLHVGLKERLGFLRGACTEEKFAEVSIQIIRRLSLEYLDGGFIKRLT